MNFHISKMKKNTVRRSLLSFTAACHIMLTGVTFKARSQEQREDRALKRKHIGLGWDLTRPKILIGQTTSQNREFKKVKGERQSTLACKQTHKHTAKKMSYQCETETEKFSKQYFVQMASFVLVFLFCVATVSQFDCWSRENEETSIGHKKM